MNESFNNIRLGCGVRGEGMGAGEGIIAFAAKRDDVPDGRAPGIEAFSFAPCFYLYPKEKDNRINMVIINV